MARTISLNVTIIDLDKVQTWADDLVASVRALYEENRLLRAALAASLGPQPNDQKGDARSVLDAMVTLGIIQPERKGEDDA